MKCTADSAASSLATDLKTLEKKEIHMLTRIGGTESCLCHFDSFPIVTIHHGHGYNLYYYNFNKQYGTLCWDDDTPHRIRKMY